MTLCCSAGRKRPPLNTTLGGENRTFLGEEVLVRAHGVMVDVLQDPRCIDADDVHPGTSAPLGRGHRRRVDRRHWRDPRAHFGSCPHIEKVSSSEHLGRGPDDWRPSRRVVAYSGTEKARGAARTLADYVLVTVERPVDGVATSGTRTHHAA